MVDFFRILSSRYPPLTSIQYRTFSGEAATSLFGSGIQMFSTDKTFIPSFQIGTLFRRCKNEPNQLHVQGVHKAFASICTSNNLGYEFPQLRRRRTVQVSLKREVLRPLWESPPVIKKLSVTRRCLLALLGIDRRFALGSSAFSSFRPHQFFFPSLPSNHRPHLSRPPTTVVSLLYSFAKQPTFAGYRLWIIHDKRAGMEHEKPGYILVTGRCA